MKYQHLKDISDKCEEYRFKTRIPALLSQNLHTAKINISLSTVDLDKLLSTVNFMDKEDAEVTNRRLSEEFEWWPFVWEDYSNLEFRKRNEAHEEMYLKYPQLALWYCMITTQHNLGEAPMAFKKVVARDAKSAVLWSSESEKHWVTGGNAEKTIAKSAEWSVRYAENYMKRFLLGEPAIYADPKWAAEYERLIESNDINGDESVEHDGYLDW